jgi:ubiquinone biosynthesis protein UbiJ
MLTHAPIAALNHLLAAAPWARTRLSPFAGQSFSIDIPPLSLQAKITPEGLLSPSEAEQPNVVITLPMSALPQIFSGVQSLFREAHIRGEAELAEAIGFVARHLQWDAEEDLARWIGDIAAHRAVSTARALFEWQKQSAIHLSENLAEYLTEEKRVLMRPAPLKTFIEDVDDLRDAIARLEKRIHRLRG